MCLVLGSGALYLGSLIVQSRGTADFHLLATGTVFVNLARGWDQHTFGLGLDSVALTSARVDKTEILGCRV